MKQFITYLIFAISITTTSIVVILNLFPALFSIFTDPFNSNVINPFESGFMLLTFIIGNTILSFLIISYKKRYPNFIYNLIQKFFNYELTKKKSLIIFLILCSLYTYHFLQDFTIMENWPDFYYLKKVLLNPSLGYNAPILAQINPPFNIELFFITVFNSWKLFPVLTSGILLLQTFLFSQKLSGKRLSGIISTAVLLQSSIFLIYDSSYTYNFLWALLFILSLYVINYRWYFSPPSFFFAYLSKALVAVLFPITFFYIILLNITLKKKLLLLGTYGIFAISGFIIMYFSHQQIGGFDIINVANNFQAEQFFSGFTSFSQQLRYDSFIVIFLIPLTIGLFLKAKEGKKQANMILLMITITILSTGPFLYSVADFTIQPYRHILLIVFISIGFGMLVSNHDSEGKNTDHMA